MTNLRHGHAPGYLREAFCDWIDADQPETVDIEGEEKPVNWLLGQLWNCTDCLPASSCDDLAIPKGSTYAAAVQKLKAERTAIL